MASDLKHSSDELHAAFRVLEGAAGACAAKIPEIIEQAKHLGAIKESARVAKLIEAFADHDERSNRSLVDCILDAIAPLCLCGRKLDDPEITPCDRCEWIAAGRPEEDFEKAERDGEVP